MKKYFINKKYNNGDIISMLTIDLYNTNKYNNVLFVRTPTTGDWLDKILVDSENITRIAYYTNKTQNQCEYHKLTNIVKSDDLEITLASLNKKFDLICIDPFHEYIESYRDFMLLPSMLSDNGILVSHDCFPPSKNMSVPKYICGNWCGETYLAFVAIANKYTNMFYGILNIDTGIGIMSKLQFELLTNNCNKDKQEQLLLLHSNFNDAYTYFVENSKDVINAIYLESE
jgi:hypothetical protein